MNSFVVGWQLRARFAQALSDLYGAEVPAYRTLVAVTQRVNATVLQDQGAAAERLGSIQRVSAERHGAIRVGTPAELHQVARIFNAVGMYPTGFYDLRDATPAPVPVISTAFRPVDAVELARNPFRVFTSLLVVDDRRFFDAELSTQLAEFLGRRELFDPKLLAIADRAGTDGGLPEPLATEFIRRATAAFALSQEPVDRSWYERLEKTSAVAADVGGVKSTHINHLTPRVLDIDLLYQSMTAEGIEMISEIQGPPRWDGPEVLLRQTSFRALAEPRKFLEADGTVTAGELRVRFGEVEARGLALTPAGRDRYDTLIAQMDRAPTEPAKIDRGKIDGAKIDSAQIDPAAIWASGFPATEQEFAIQDLAFFRYAVTAATPAGPPPATVPELLSQGWITAEPIVYEDFLPRSAAGIFASNLSQPGEVDGNEAAPARDADWLAGALGRPLNDPMDLYTAERDASLRSVAKVLAIKLG